MPCRFFCQKRWKRWVFGIFSWIFDLFWHSGTDELAGIDGTRIGLIRRIFSDFLFWLNLNQKNQKKNPSNPCAINPICVPLFERIFMRGIIRKLRISQRFQEQNNLLFLLGGECWQVQLALRGWFSFRSTSVQCLKLSRIFLWRQYYHIWNSIRYRKNVRNITVNEPSQITLPHVTKKTIT